MKRKIPKKKKKNDASKSCLLSLQRWCQGAAAPEMLPKTYIRIFSSSLLPSRQTIFSRCRKAMLGSVPWAKCQIRRRGTRPGGAKGSARARPSQALREILVSSSNSSGRLGPDFLHATTDGRTTFKHSRWTVGRGTMHRIMVSGLHREHRGVCPVRSIQGAAAAANARWSTSKRKKTEAQGAVLNLDGPHSHRIGVMGRWFSSTIWPLCSTNDRHTIFMNCECIWANAF